MKIHKSLRVPLAMQAGLNKKLMTLFAKPYFLEIELRERQEIGH